MRFYMLYNLKGHFNKFILYLKTMCFPAYDRFNEILEFLEIYCSTSSVKMSSFVNNLPTKNTLIF